MQFQTRYGEHTTIKVHNVDFNFKVKIKFESIENKLNTKGSSSRKALYEALQDVAAHVVIEAEGLAQASVITLSVIVKAIEKEGFTFLKGNRERMKLEGESGTFVSKVAHSTRWHIYISAVQGNFLAGNFPRKLILIIDNKAVPVNYAIRACKPLQMPQALQSGGRDWRSCEGGTPRYGA